MLLRHFHIPVLSVRRMSKNAEQPPPTYQEILAEIYQDNATNQYVFDRFYENEDVDGFADDKYQDQEIQEDREAFNKFGGNRLQVENVVIPPPNPNEQGKSSYGYNKDIRSSTVNLDGRFRNVPVRFNNNEPLTREQCAADVAAQTNFGDSSSSQFVISLARQYKNVTSVKINTLEFDNSFYTFTAKNEMTGLGRENTVLEVTVTGTTGTGAGTALFDYGPYLVQIPDGNYEVQGLVQTLITAMNYTVYNGNVGNAQYNVPPLAGFTGIGVSGQTGFTGYINPQTLGFTIGCYFPFFINFPQTNDNFTKNGIGYNLGFYDLNVPVSRFIYGSPGTFYSLTSDTRPDVVQDRYVYLVINDWAQIAHQYPDQSELQAFVKIQLTAAKFTTQYNNIEFDTDRKEYFFPQPVNIQKLNISLVDSYGSTLNMQGGAISMSLSINEILQSSIYEKLLQL